MTYQGSQNANIPTMRYLAYAMLVQAKGLIGMDVSRQRNFLMWKLIKLIESGKISTNQLCVTSVGKIDGAGAQAMAKFSAMCLAQAYGLTYLHAPFGNLAHAEFSPELWAEKWESLLNMGANHERFDPKSMQVVSLGEYVNDSSLWDQPVVLADRHFHAFCKLSPASGSETSKKLRGAFDRAQLPLSEGSDFVIGVHVRRGDVNTNNSDTKHRFTSSNHTVFLLEQAIQAALDAGHQPEIHLHTNGSKEELSSFSQLPNIRYFAGSSALETFTSLATADILITARSDFSMLAALYCKGIVICDPRHRTPLPEWLKATPNCDKLRKALAFQLNSLTTS